MQSMTGFGRGVCELGDGRVVLELKSVNHRFLEIRCHSPKETLRGEALIEKEIKKTLGRGYINVHLWYENTRGSASALNRGALAAHLGSLIEVGEEFELCLSDLIGVLAGAPDLFVPFPVLEESVVDKAIETALQNALGQLLKMRREEGRAMVLKCREHLDLVNTHVDELGGYVKEWPKQARQKLEARLNTLLGERSAELDPGRLEVEMAFLADRSDVSEELTRLQSHLRQMELLLDGSGEIGRKVEFLLQELGREIHTLGTKAGMSEVSTVVVGIKAELEKLRELAQNIE